VARSRRPLNRFLAGKYRSELRPHISAERLRFDRREYNRQFEHSCGFGERHRVIYNGLTIKVAYPKQHLWLMIDERHNAIVWSEQPFFTTLWTNIAWTHFHSSIDLRRTLRNSFATPWGGEA
jgi:hypothetical protein